MAVDLNQSIPSWTDGVDHWRQIDVSWLRDRVILRLADRTVLGASSGNAGQTIFSIADQQVYTSANTGSSYNWKLLLSSSKLVVEESGDPQIRLSTGGSGSGITWKTGSVIAVTNLQVSGTATVNGSLTAAGISSSTTLSSTGNLTVGGSQTIAGNLTVTGTVTASGITGSSTTAAKLATARQISLSGDATGSTLFDGSSNVVLPVTVANKSVANVANTLVLRDASGNFAMGTVTATNGAFSGTINVTGQLTGSIGQFTQVNTSGSVICNGSVNVAVQVLAGGTITGDWATAHFIANGVVGGAAAIALRTASQAAQLRLGTAVNDLYFRNFNDSAFINLQAASFVVGCSVKFKTDIKPAHIDALDIVRNLRPVSWLSKDVGDKRRYIGFTAEALADTFPEAVIRGENGKPEGVNTTAMDTLALVATKQLLDRIETLESRVASMSGVNGQAGR